MCLSTLSSLWQRNVLQLLCVLHNWRALLTSSGHVNISIGAHSRVLKKYSDAAWSTGLVLENLRLKVEAFEYLQLPFAIQEGTLGRLEIQVIHPP